MESSHTGNPTEEMTLFANQHNTMLQCCCQIADLDIPWVIRKLEGALITTGDGPLEPEQEEARQRLKENIAVARLALEIHRELKRQIRTRYKMAWQ